MDTGIKISVDTSQVTERVRWLDAYIGKMVVRLINESTLMLQNHMRGDLFGSYPEGTTATTLSSRTGILKKSVKNVAAYRDGDMVYGGVSVDSPYASPHFGKKGDKTTITGNPWLKIPLPPVLNARGLVKDFVKLFWRKSKTNSEDLVMYGQMVGWSTKKGVRSKGAKGDVLPLFVLKHQVTIPVRIASEDLQAYIMPFVGKGLATIKSGLMSSTVGSQV